MKCNDIIWFNYLYLAKLIRRTTSHYIRTEYCFIVKFNEDNHRMMVVLIIDRAAMLLFNRHWKHDICFSSHFHILRKIRLPRLTYVCMYVFAYTFQFLTFSTHHHLLLLYNLFSPLLILFMGKKLQISKHICIKCTCLLCEYLLTF